MRNWIRLSGDINSTLELYSQPILADSLDVNVYMQWARLLLESGQVEDAIYQAKRVSAVLSVYLLTPKRMPASCPVSTLAPGVDMHRLDEQRNWILPSAKNTSFKGLSRR